MSTDMRFDPFRFEYRPVNLTGETRLVEYHTAFKRVGFFLKETPQRLQTQRISIVCGGDTLSEVGRTVEPPIDNFRVDYGNINAAASTGFVEVHASRIGQVAVVNYRGLGKNLNASDRTDGRWTINRSVSVNTDVVSIGLEVGNFQSREGIDCGASRFRDVAAPILVSDAVNKLHLNDELADNTPAIVSAVEDVSEFAHGSQYFSASGAWTRPTNVRFVSVFMWAGGGGGYGPIGGSATGGGGGGSMRFIADLGVSPDPTYSVTVGGGGGGGLGTSSGGNSSVFGAVANGGAGGGGSIPGGGAGGNGSVASVASCIFHAIYSGANGDNGGPSQVNGGGGGGVYASSSGTSGGAGGGGGAFGGVGGVHGGGGGRDSDIHTGGQNGARGGVLITW